MRVVLGELAHPHDAVQRAVRLVAVAAAELGHADRQVAIAVDALLEDQDVRRAVHRLQRHQVGLARQHRRVLLGRWGSRRGRRTYSRDTCPSGRDCSHWLRVHQLRRLDLVIAGGVEPAAHIGLELAPEDEALGMPEDAALRLGLEVEQVHLLADLAMVALGRLLQPDEMLRRAASC